MKTTRYWFAFDFEIDDGSPFGLVMGCGVTAYDYKDAISILEEKVFHGPVPKTKSVVENIDISTLDPGHVLPNMGLTIRRGVWFPLGYE
ncbi:MAG: hypothetical protein V2I43_10660 [Parvularcula sp.]|jgi:hypothetical protein|nr:hypothetical protein [Parvularcula sp.]